MKTIQEFVEEYGTYRAAGKKLGKPFKNVHRWCNSDHQHYVIFRDGKYIVLGEK